MCHCQPNSSDHPKSKLPSASVEDCFTALIDWRLRMTGLRKYEKPPQPSNRPSPGLLLKRAHQSQVVSSSVRLLLLASSFLGYAIVSLALIAVALELMCWPIWYVLPAQRQQGQRASPVYAGADWASEFWKEETLRTDAQGVHPIPPLGCDEVEQQIYQ